MFTGLVEEFGVLVSQEQRGNDYSRLSISCKKILSDMQVGDSIAINGTCQTVVSFDSHSFTVEAFHETLKKTNFLDLKVRETVHLERALRADSRLGGHFVQGHIDGIARLKEVRQEGINRYLVAELDEHLLDLCIPHGSICLDGVSLTIAQLHENAVEVNIISHTWDAVRFSRLKTGDKINVECDVLGKYILRLSQRGLLVQGGHKQKEQNLEQLLKDW